MFDTKAQERLGYYVYALFGPNQPALPFYIGKGRGNRVFAHALGESFEAEDGEPLSAKLEAIRNIRQCGASVIHKIVRFGLSEEEALKIEAALIDMVNHIAPDTLTNEISGQGVAEGFYDTNDLVLALCAKELSTELPVLIIKIERHWSRLMKEYGSAAAIPLDQIYEATKGDWRLCIDRAKQAACVLSVARGLVRAVIVPDGWVDAGYENRKVMTGSGDASRYADFVGTSVAYVFGRGNQNPIRYLRC